NGQIVLLPNFTAMFSRANLSNSLGNVLLFGAVGMLVASSAGAGHPVRRALGWGFCLASIIEFGQLFVVGRYSKTADVIVGTLAAVGGAVISQWISLGPRTRPNRRVAVRWFVIAVGYAVCLVVVFTAPFDWLDKPVQISKRWRNLWRIPFGYAKYW